jgi:hypothetical protein
MKSKLARVLAAVSGFDKTANRLRRANLEIMWVILT